MPRARCSAGLLLVLLWLCSALTVCISARYNCSPALMSTRLWAHRFVRPGRHGVRERIYHGSGYPRQRKEHGRSICLHTKRRESLRFHVQLPPSHVKQREKSDKDANRSKNNIRHRIGPLPGSNKPNPWVEPKRACFGLHTTAY